MCPLSRLHQRSGLSNAEHDNGRTACPDLNGCWPSHSAASTHAHNAYSDNETRTNNRKAYSIDDYCVTTHRQPPMAARRAPAVEPPVHAGISPGPVRDMAGGRARPSGTLPRTCGRALCSRMRPAACTRRGSPRASVPSLPATWPVSAFGRHRPFSQAPFRGPGRRPLAAPLPVVWAATAPAQRLRASRPRRTTGAYSAVNAQEHRHTPMPWRALT